jgi:hypothetical protein
MLFAERLRDKKKRFGRPILILVRKSFLEMWQIFRKNEGMPT